jgi:hypothetical protein
MTEDLAPATAPPADVERLGRTAMKIAVPLFFGSIIASVLIAIFATSVTAYAGAANAGFHENADPLPSGLHIAIGSGLGLWALIQGIVATVENRGRRYGIVAIVFAGAAPIVSLIVWAAVGFASR